MIKNILSCDSILGGLMGNPVFDIPSVKVEGKVPLTLCAAEERDVEPTTNLIHSAYKYWVDHGVIVSPATQPVEKTRQHLLGGGGFVATDEAGAIRATFSVDKADIETNQNVVTMSSKHSKSVINFESTTTTPTKGRFLEFKKLAVDPVISGQGVGQALYNVAEEFARTHGYDGVALETVREATWLYDWYIGMGFQVMGQYTYPGSKLVTLLLMKRF